jgi:DNA replication and repair protein RecF
MSLAELRLENLRCFGSAELALDPGLNLISGGNGSGKTTLLEAIHLLGRGRSFRTRHTVQLIRHDASHLLVFGRTEPPPGHAIGLQCTYDAGVRVHIDRVPASSRQSLSETLPVQVIDPGIHRLVEEGPGHRRRWLDWAVFHVEPRFVALWQDYTRALRQRNAALQAHAHPWAWDPELIRLGESLIGLRAGAIAQLQHHWTTVLDALGAETAAMELFPGWSRGQSLADALESRRARDQERGHTVAGPHRFDVLIRVQGRPAREVVSRGQQKLLGIAMAVALARYVSESAGRNPILLLDDPAAELDSDRTDALVRMVLGLRTQLIVTSLHPGETRWGTPGAAFHVERGEVEQL